MPTTLTFIGNLAADPDLRFTPSGTAVAHFTLIDTPRKFDKQTNEFKDGEPIRQRVVVWGDQAENIAETATKGMRLWAIGHLEQRPDFEKDGEKIRPAIELNAEEVGPSLKWATATVTKATRKKAQG
ncbi:single-stranded DNA-binding protein [Mycobacteroides chelonae]|uniref:single-stranded DNA-binding protein n=1 Tax=Mycobacteroides chelonae TaxID=1774 RepID=UPI0039EC64CC